MPERAARKLDRSGAATLKGFVEECSQCALEVSLTCERLDNLQRARPAGHSFVGG